ncbi:Uncharacterised protein [Chlamydia trachomatis]|nr:Uncharacterised protein [Chlamydia trachomatis]
MKQSSTPWIDGLKYQDAQQSLKIANETLKNHAMHSYHKAKHALSAQCLQAAALCTSLKKQLIKCMIIAIV